MNPTQPAMKVSPLLLGIVGIVLSGLGGLMLFTNPSPRDYHHYALETLDHYLKDDLCMQVSNQLNGAISSYCKAIVDAGKPQIASVIEQSTVRHNYVFFSIYITSIRLPSPIPQYQFETLGILEQFYTFDQEEI